jgi:hypothetical protein
MKFQKYEGFDELTKELSAPVSRRRALQSFIVGGATGALALLESPRAEAYPGRCRKVHAICRTDYECCSSFCNPSTGRCACPQGSHFCKQSGQCVFCRGGGTFHAATCTCSCPEGKVKCGPTNCCENRPNGTNDCCPGGYCNFPYYGGYYC